MFCPACGRDNPPNAQFCGHCGKPQSPVPEAQPQPAPGIENVRALTARLIDLSKQAMRVSPRRTKDWTGFIRKELMDLVLYFAALDRCISEREAQVYSDISNTIDPGLLDNPGGVLDMLMSARIDNSSPMTLDRPLLLDLMEECDSANKTSYAAEARRTFFQIASAIAWADGPPAGIAGTELDRYKALLQPRSSPNEGSAILDANLPNTQKSGPHVEESKTEQTKLGALNAPEPFGFRVAMSKAQVLALMSPQSVLKDDGDSLELSSAPAPHEDFQTYVVSVSPSSGIAQVMALSKDITTNVYGEAVKQKFDDVKAALNKHYGDPTNAFDSLGEGSIWTEPTEWMMGLAKAERILSAFWAAPNNTHVSLEASASTQESGYLIVKYQYSNFETWLAEHNEKRNRVL